MNLPWTLPLFYTVIFSIDQNGLSSKMRSFISLSESLSSYARYLNQKAKRMNLYHRSPTPIRELSSNLKLKFILPSVVPPPSLHHIDAVLVSKSEYEMSL